VVFSYFAANAGDASCSLSVCTGFAQGASHAQYATAAIIINRKPTRRANAFDARRRRAFGEPAVLSLEVRGAIGELIFEFDRIR
jgi:hypothetical protein